MVKGNRTISYKYLYIYIYILIFYTMIFQGAYFTVGLLVLDIAFIMYILIDKETVKIDINFLILSLLLGIMLISTFLFSINYYVASVELLKYLLYPLSYVVFLKAGDTERVSDIFYKSFIMLMGFGLLAWLGVSVFPGMVTIQGNRLQSFLQYANTTALFMGIGVLLSIHKFLKDRDKKYVFLGIFFFIALILTQSRTTFVVFLFVLGLYVFKIFAHKKKVIWGLFSVLTVLIMALYGGRITRISIFEPTLIERIITFQDAIRILLRKPLGLGTGNWAFKQFMYQSSPYQVRYIHNIYLQIALDGGLIALIGFLGMILYNFFKLYKDKTIYFYLFILIILHSVLEVNFNFGILIIFFTHILTPFSNPIDFKYKLKDLKIAKHIKYVLVIPLVCLMLFLLSELVINNANLQTNKAEAKKLYTAAYKFNPINNDLLFKQAQVEQDPDKAIALLEKGYSKNPYDYQVMMSLAQGYLYKEDFEKAYFYGGKLFEIFPYNKDHQDFLGNLIGHFYAEGILTQEKHNLLQEKLKNEILAKNKAINSLYYYINNDMDY